MTRTSLINVLVQQNDELVDYISYRFGDRQFAQEVVQETCIRVLQVSLRTEEIQSPIALLKKMSLRVAIDFYRKEKLFQNWIEICDEPPQMKEDSYLRMTDPELITAKAQRTQLLLQTIEKLPLCCRDVFILTQLYHYPQHQVAEQLNISRGMVARHLAKALKIMQPTLLVPDE